MLLVRGRIDLWLGHRSCWFKFLALQETSFMALGDSRTATLQNGSSTQTEEIFPREIPSHFSTQMGTQVDRSSRCCKKIFWKCAIKVGAIGFGHFFLLVSFLFFPSSPPFFFSSSFFPVKVWLWCWLLSVWESDPWPPLGFWLLVILGPGFPAENGDHNAFFILPPASFVSLDTEALRRGIVFYNIQVFHPNLWGGLKEMGTLGISLMKRSTQVVVEAAVLVFNKWWAQFSSIKDCYRKRRQFGSESGFLQDLGMLRLKLVGWAHL